MTAAWRAGASCDHGVSKVLGPGASEDCSVARYGSIWACRSPGCCSIHSRAARQAWKYSSSVDSAAALDRRRHATRGDPRALRGRRLGFRAGRRRRRHRAAVCSGRTAQEGAAGKKPAVARAAARYGVPAHAVNLSQHWPPCSSPSTFAQLRAFKSAVSGAYPGVAPAARRLAEIHRDTPGSVGGPHRLAI